MGSSFFKTKNHALLTEAKYLFVIDRIKSIDKLSIMIRMPGSLWHKATGILRPKKKG